MLFFKSNFPQIAILMVTFSFVAISSCNPGKTINIQAQKEREEVKLTPSVQQISTPANINFVYDFETIFTPTEVLKLDTLVRRFEKSNLIPIKIVTLGADSSSLEQTSFTLLKEWDAMHGKSNKSMVIVISKTLGKTIIHYGSFITKFLSDQETKTIIDTYFVPAYKSDTLYKSIFDGITAIMDTIRKNINFNPQPIKQEDGE